MFKKAAWAYAWAGVNTGMHMQVHVWVRLCVPLEGHNPWHTVNVRGIFSNDLSDIYSQDQKINS